MTILEGAAGAIPLDKVAGNNDAIFGVVDGLLLTGKRTLKRSPLPGNNTKGRSLTPAYAAGAPWYQRRDFGTIKFLLSAPKYFRSTHKARGALKAIYRQISLRLASSQPIFWQQAWQQAWQL